MIEKIVEELRSGESEVATVQAVLSRAVNELLPGADGLEKLMEERRIKLYLGIDPTSPNLHIGHSVPLRTLRRFQDLGHEVVLLFGTFTGMIGDPTDKSASRVKLTREQVDRNVATYVEQAGKILDLAPEAKNPVTIAYNHEWLGKMTFAEVIELMSNFSAQQMLERSMFKDRIASNRPVWMHELAYPLMQGWDAVALGVDLEVGGKDQTFNMLVGRDLVKRYLSKDKWVLATKLIEDPSGKKMGKTEGNIVNIMDWPEWMYEAILSWPDATVPLGFELITNVPHDYIDVLKWLIEMKDVDIYQLKKSLAYRAVAELHGNEAARYAEEEFDLVIRHKNRPRRIKSITIETAPDLATALVVSGLVKDRHEAEVKIGTGSVFIEGKKAKAGATLEKGMVFSLGLKSIKGYRCIE